MDKKTQVDFKGFYHSLDQASRERFAVAAGTSAKYVEAHLIRGSRVPRPKLMAKLFVACQEFNAPFTSAELMTFFYQHEQKLSCTEQAVAA